MSEFSFVAEPDSITTALQEHYVLGVDTEFVREKTYYAQLCLVQVAVPDAVYCVDPLAADRDSPFWGALCAGMWVVHSARQDIEVVYQSCDRMPRSLFDTQIAAALLGFAPQLGYAALVSELFTVELPKSHTRADWSQRPLPDALLRYAADDVKYLLPAGAELRERLEACGRLDWAEEDSALLLQPTLYEIDAAQAAGRLKGARNLRGAARGAAARLAAWRETEAIRRNRPRQWILRDNVLLEIAAERPQSMRELRRIDALPGKLVQRDGQRLLEAVSGPDTGDGVPAPASPPDEAQKGLLKAMQAVVADCARELGIHAEVVAPRKELSAAILSGDTDSRVFTGWRRELIGERLLAML